jgi:hypothetical protein
MPCSAHGNVDTDVFDVALAVDVPLPASMTGGTPNG